MAYYAAISLPEPSANSTASYQTISSAITSTKTIPFFTTRSGSDKPTHEETFPTTKYATDSNTCFSSNSATHSISHLTAYQTTRGYTIATAISHSIISTNKATFTFSYTTAIKATYSTPIATTFLLSCTFTYTSATQTANYATNQLTQ